MDAHLVLATRLGVLAQDGMLALLHYYDWRYVPEHCKTKIWNEIKVKKNFIFLFYINFFEHIRMLL